MIEDCRPLGVTFSLDDFGTGYSTLAHLRHLPATEIKIDLTFVGQMLANAEDLAIVEAVIGLARAFDRTVVAEGARLRRAEGLDETRPGNCRSCEWRCAWLSRRVFR